MGPYLDRSGSVNAFYGLNSGKKGEILNINSPKAMRGFPDMMSASEEGGGS